MTVLNNVFYWPLSTGNKINTAYNIVPKLAKFFIDTINDCPEITLKAYEALHQRRQTIND